MMGRTRGVVAVWLAVAAGLAAVLPAQAAPVDEAGERVQPLCRVLDAELRQSYTGGCENGLAQGQGVARGKEGAWYRGGFEKGAKSGYGVKLYANGDGYVGGWRDDKREGQGRYEYGPHSPWRGDIYQGGWHDDQRHGEGVYYFFPSGDRFAAHWEAGATKDEGTTTVTRRKQAYEVLGPALSHKGLAVCSVMTRGASPQRMARGRVVDALGDRLLVQLESTEVLAHSPDPALNPRWEVLTEWMLCPTTHP